MLSRIADSLFWLNRYTERADSLLRHVYVHYILSLDRAINTDHHWRSVLEIYSPSPTALQQKMEEKTPEVLNHLFLDSGNGNSVKAIVTKARENARGAQDHITKEVWEVVNGLYHQINQSSLSSKLRTEQAIKAIDGFAKHTALFAGITDNTMSRGLGWNFMNLGKFIERCQQTLVLTKKELDHHLLQQNVGNDILQWRYLLLALSGYEMHLKTYSGSDHRYNALHQITLNENFTRSITYSLVRVKHYLQNIMDVHGEQQRDLLHTIGRLNSNVHYMNLQAMDTLSLQNFLKDVEKDLGAFTQQLGQAYFSYS